MQWILLPGLDGTGDLFVTFVVSPLPRWWRIFVRPAWIRPAPPIVIRSMLAGLAAPQPLVQSVIRSVEKNQPDVFSQRIHNVLSIDATGELANAQIPILLLQARWDRLVRARRSGFDRFPHLTKRVLDSPHLLLQTKPQQAYEIISSFVSNL